MRPRRQRGAALAWSMIVMFVVTMAATLIADGLSRRARLLRQQSEAAALADLSRSGRALQRVRARDPSWTGPETLRLAGGSVTVTRDGIRARSALSGREIAP